MLRFAPAAALLASGALAQEGGAKVAANNNVSGEGGDAVSSSRRS
jgi:hypothetical protein